MLLCPEDFSLGHRMGSQFPGIFAAYQDAVKSVCTIEKVTLGSLFWQRTVVEKNAAVTHTEWISWLFLAFWSLGEVLPKTQTPSVTHGDFNQRLLWVTCLCFEELGCEKWLAPAFRVSTLVRVQIFIWFLLPPPNTDWMWSWVLESQLANDSYLLWSWLCLPKPSLAHPWAWALCWT